MTPAPVRPLSTGVGPVDTGMMLRSLVAAAACAAVVALLPGCAAKGSEGVVNPMTDDRGGSTHIGVDAPCPPAGVPSGVSNAVGGLNDVMVRPHYAGSPIRSAHVCEWRPGAPGRPMVVVDVHHGTSAARALATYVNALPSFSATAEYGCPEDDGGVALVVFGYGAGRDIDVEARLSGCRIVSNGWRRALAVAPLDDVLSHPGATGLAMTVPPRQVPTSLAVH